MGAPTHRYGKKKKQQKTNGGTNTHTKKEMSGDFLWRGALKLGGGLKKKKRPQREEKEKRL